MERPEKAKALASAKAMLQDLKEFWNACTRSTDKSGLCISVPGSERSVSSAEYARIRDAFAANKVIRWWRRKLAGLASGSRGKQRHKQKAYLDTGEHVEHESCFGPQ